MEDMIVFQFRFHIISWANTRHWSDLIWSVVMDRYAPLYAMQRMSSTPLFKSYEHLPEHLHNGISCRDYIVQCVLVVNASRASRVYCSGDVLLPLMIQLEVAQEFKMIDWLNFVRTALTFDSLTPLFSLLQCRRFNLSIIEYRVSTADRLTDMIRLRLRLILTLPALPYCLQ